MAEQKRRLNPNAAIPREDLALALGDRHIVARAIQRNECLLCCAAPVNEAGLCLECFPILTDAERRLCEPYFWKVDM